MLCLYTGLPAKLHSDWSIKMVNFNINFNIVDVKLLKDDYKLKIPKLKEQYGDFSGI